MASFLRQSHVDLCVSQPQTCKRAVRDMRRLRNKVLGVGPSFWHQTSGPPRPASEGLDGLLAAKLEPFQYV